jgi:chaperonin cofactor prefoldin
VESSQDLGKVSSDIAALRVHNETLEATNKSLKSDLEALKANITQLQNAKAGK